MSRHRTINGYRVIVSNFTARQGSPAAQELCADADGLNIYLWTGRGTGVPAAAEIFAHYFRLLGTNPANWTTRPLGWVCRQYWAASTVPPVLGRPSTEPPALRRQPLRCRN